MKTKHTMFEHQDKFLKESLSRKSYAAFWQQGTGKTKFMLDTMIGLWHNREISGMLLVAPDGVQTQWIEDEIPKHVHEDYIPHLCAHPYESSKGSTKKQQRKMEELLEPGQLNFLGMTYGGITTKVGHKTAMKFLRKNKTLMCLDEGRKIKTPRIQRTRMISQAGKLASYRRLLTGTPVSNGPFDIWQPIKWLDRNFWKQYQLDTFSGFKKHFGLFQEGYNSKTDKHFEYCYGYRRLDELHEILQSISSRILKADVFDLPPKLYSKRYFDLSPTQERMYKELTAVLSTEFMGERISTPLAITKLLRLQQICCGYLPIAGENTNIEESNPRIKTLTDCLEDISGKVIIWARFTEDVDQIMAMLKKAGEVAVRYDGKVKHKERDANKKAFQNISIKDGGPAYFVGNQQAGANGLDLWAATTVIYYSNNFKLDDREQSEDRAHRYGTTKPVNYIDITARGTIDSKILAALISKYDVQSQITGDALMEWIR